MDGVQRLVRPLAVATLVGLGGGGTYAVSRTQAAPAPALVQATQARMLVDARGRALYVYAPDKKNKSVCYGECAEYWPPAIVPAGVTVPAAMPGIAGTFGVTTRTNGKRQLTYDGAPLYRFVKDKKPGDMTGQGLDVAGGYWWLVVVNSAQSGGQGGSQTGSAATAATAATASGGYYAGGDDRGRGRGGSASATSPTPGSHHGGGDG